MKGTILPSGTDSTKCAFCGTWVYKHPHQFYITTTGRGSITIVCSDTRGKLLHSSRYTRDASASMSPAQAKLLVHCGPLIRSWEQEQSEKPSSSRRSQR